ncbi:DEAD/DEAH box helicase family protein [Gemella sp. GH3]|uniref:DEAD/DEAH box helicase n=1 Tax=unclassified Gemella TaxID=2624949 RepID=UPI0015CFE9C4|nr:MULTISPECIES: DEAD/DEAH box helicase family protein [unclassified Gemella]MBF0714115.1 DEAD/DEAH box helicase family protein [Gemella sp. GH3.1]NYS51067.1 DEAD/DEAH box helicase family protein [Gemella sp. GH3]
MIGLKLKNFQEKAVDFLFEKTTNINSKPKIIMQSPTGSGKTIILVAYIEKYLDYHEEDIICWFCPGKGELEEQSKEKMNRFAPSLKTGSLFDILCNGFISGTTYFINWETITKKDNTAIRDSERKNLFERISEAHRKGKKFIIIIDEEHQNNTSKADDIISSINAKYEIRVSATPNKRVVGEFHEIPEVDVINEELITRFMYINKGLESVSVLSPKNEAEILLKKADEVRKEIAHAYMDEKEEVKPLVLVQFPNLNDELIEFVENKLNSMGYSYENKLLASWFSAENKEDKARKSKKIGKINIGTTDEDSITKANATPVFLLFKQALATGWDCPRAKILVKLRENMSDTFEIQTLGRLRRMPKAKHYGKDILDCSYLYTFDEKYKLDVIKAGSGFETQRLFLKDEAKAIKLKKELRNKDGNYVDEQLMRNRIYEFFKERYSLDGVKQNNRIRLENAGFILGTTLKRSYLTGKYSTLMQINEEHAQYGVMGMEVNTHIHGIDRQHCVDAIKKHIGLSYDKTHQILKTLFLKGFGNKRYKLLNLNLREFYAFIINNVDKLKKDFIEFSGKKYEQQTFLENRVEDFSIPLEEHYRYVPFEPNVRNLESNVYKEYNTSMITDDFRSTSERLFEKYCDKNPNVKYVYKNGDSGQQYLSLVYGTNFDKQRLFYPDYIIQLQDDSIWLIETKGGEKNGQSKNIDVQIENKFEAFKEFATKHGYNFGFVRDRNDELYLNNTYYVENMRDSSWILLEEVF